MEKKEFCTFLKELREQAGLSMGQLAKRAKVSQPYISQIESGQRGVPTLETLRRLAEPLGVDHFLLGVKAGHIKDEDYILWGLKSLEDPDRAGYVQQEHMQFVSEMMAGLQLPLGEYQIETLYNTILQTNDEHIRFEALHQLYRRSMKRFGYSPFFRLKSSQDDQGERLSDIAQIISGDRPLTYNGRTLSANDRKRILDMLAILFSPN